MNSKQRRQFDRALVRYMQGERNARCSDRAARTLQRMLWWSGASPVAAFAARYRRAGPLAHAWLVERRRATRALAKLPRFGASIWHTPVTQRTQTARPNPASAAPGALAPVAQCRYCDGTGHLYRDTANPVRCDRCDSALALDDFLLLEARIVARDTRDAVARGSDLHTQLAEMFVPSGDLLESDLAESPSGRWRSQWHR